MTPLHYFQFPVGACENDEGPYTFTLADSTCRDCVSTMYAKATRFERVFAMPSADTFRIEPIAALLDRWLSDRDVVVDPFARNSDRGTWTNDLDPHTAAEFHLPAAEFVDLMAKSPDVRVDVVLFDPPYSPRQISECYGSIGLPVTQADTQNAALYREVKDGLDRLLTLNGLAICFGWNSCGFGVTRGYELLELLLVCHGGAHNDTIVTVERKAKEQMRLELAASGAPPEAE